MRQGDHNVKQRVAENKGRNIGLGALLLSHTV